jgi:hypothetical protein
MEILSWLQTQMHAFVVFIPRESSHYHLGQDIGLAVGTVLNVQ